MVSGRCWPMKPNIPHGANTTTTSDGPTIQQLALCDACSQINSVLSGHFQNLKHYETQVNNRALTLLSSQSQEQRAKAETKFRQEMSMAVPSSLDVQIVIYVVVYRPTYSSWQIDGQTNIDGHYSFPQQQRHSTIPSS